MFMFQRQPFKTWTRFSMNHDLFWALFIGLIMDNLIGTFSDAIKNKLVYMSSGDWVQFSRSIEQCTKKPIII